ncbi:hypothetical protein ACFRMQ_11375 [Kitasatospora sp. NPDC056783]|uniref:hypothetical protein n=1 Tax=Kitasatospora sp. NPDC056783 TaxID=3345943 RepID=UPI0036BB3CBD
MRHFRSRAVRAGTFVLLLLSGAAFGFVEDSRPQYAAVAVITLGVVFVLFVLAELANTGDVGNAGTATAAPAAAVPAAAAPTGAATGGAPERDVPKDRAGLERCDVCGRTEPRTAAGGGGLELPEGWLDLEIDRRSAEVLYRTYCSEEHLRLGLADPLPAPVPYRGESDDPWDAPRTAGDRLVDLAWTVGLWSLCGFLLLGSVLAIRFLFGLAVSALS